MASHKSAWKRHLQSEKRRERNRNVKSALKTQIKKAREEIASGKVSPVAGEVKTAVAAIAKAKSGGALHWRTAARRMSRLMKQAAKGGNGKAEAATTTKPTRARAPKAPKKA
ncbi:MAG: 30S ribosomal protein S20 [Deltaproteobacteria bacterium]|nr:30S ribosomal protein S20 [Deltaproteobacteria bacterium]